MPTPSQRPQQDRIDTALTLWFFILAGGALVAFFLYRPTQPLLFQALGTAALVLRVIYYAKQLLTRRR